MGKIILTGLTKKGRHNLKLEYREDHGSTLCFAICTCGHIKQVMNHETYAGVKEIEEIWKEHVG
jgi:hypothetical protein